MENVIGFEDLNEEEPMHLRTWWSRLTILANKRIYDYHDTAMLNLLGRAGY